MTQEASLAEATLENQLMKRVLRREYVEKRAALSSEYRQRADESILKQLLDLEEFKAAKTVFCFVGTPDEIQTLPFIEEALDLGKTVCVPLCVSPRVMEARQILSTDELTQGRLGIQVPKENSTLIPKDEVDLIVVPCLTCTEEGYRLGYGGGYYDNYLADSPGHSAIICYKPLIRDSLPLEDYDIRAKQVITA